MVIDDRGINPFAVSEKSRWLGMPAQRRRCFICGYLGKRDPTCDTVFVAAGLITIVYQKYPDQENRFPYDIWDDIKAGKF